MKNNSLGWPGLAGFAGLDTRCLLVKVWGSVTYTGTGWFLIDDGSNLADYSSYGKGIKVLLPSGASMPSVGQMVMVTGVCRGSSGARWIMPRTASDVH